MPSFFDRFRDLDSLKEQAQDLLDTGVREGKRRAALAKLQVRLYDLDTRMNREFRVLGEKVWDLHEAGTLTPESLGGLFDKLEALADDIDEAQAEMQRLREAPADADVEPAEEAERKVEDERDS